MTGAASRDCHTDPQPREYERNAGAGRGAAAPGVSSPMLRVILISFGLVALNVVMHAIGLALLLRALMKSHSAPPLRTLTIAWILETHAHADHLTAAPYLKQRTGARTGIGEHIRDVQRIFRPVFNLNDVTGDGSEFDHLFGDGERFNIGSLEVEVLHTPGHTPACVSYRIGVAVFVGDTLFMPD